MQKLSATIQKIFENIQRKQILPSLDSAPTAQFAVAEYIARTENANELTGMTLEEAQKIFKWVDMAMKIRSKKVDISEEIKNLDSVLFTSTYLTSAFQITLADLFIFSAVTEYMQAHLDQLKEYPNVFRWFDLIQHAIPGISKLDIHTPLLAMAAEQPNLPALPSPQKPSMSTSFNRTHATTTNTSATLEQVQSPTQQPSKQKKVSTPSNPSSSDSVAASKKESQPSAPSNPSSSSSNEDEDLLVCASQLDLRVGHILSVERHPNADSLYLEKIDVGEPEPRTVLSGLAKHLPMEALQGKYCILVCNLKPVNMRGILSQAMVLCVSNTTGLTLLEPCDQDCIPGTLVSFEKVPREPVDQLKPKKKVFEKVAEQFRCMQFCAGLQSSQGFLKLITPNGVVKNSKLSEGEVR